MFEDDENGLSYNTAALLKSISGYGGSKNRQYNPMGEVLTYGGNTYNALGPVGGNKGNGFGSLTFGEKANTILGGLQTIGNLWSSFQALNLAKKQFQHTRDVTNRNLANSIQSYNTALDDRIGSRAVMQGMSDAEVQAYKDKNRLADWKG